MASPAAETVVATDPAAANGAATAAAKILSDPPKAAEPAPPASTEAVSSAATTASVAPAPAPDPGAQRTLSVQRALNLIGYGPVPEDGVAGETTIAAIRRFELDHGLPITGAAGDTVIDRLVAIGAMDAA